jgi:hypothetical protein
MLPTPKSHLPKGYPLPSDEESKKFEKVWERAFDIHASAHDFGSFLRKENKRGWIDVFGPREGILSPVKHRTKLSQAQYCDCYEQAYQEFKKAGKI